MTNDPLRKKARVGGLFYGDKKNDLRKIKIWYPRGVKWNSSGAKTGGIDEAEKNTRGG
ncbi:MAG: hypothetical protein NDI77_11120 [Geobacteraceae bacterium]|nr:hypothetical protein [Geobacteraceae bacterium]